MNINDDDMNLSLFLGSLFLLDPERVSWAVVRNNRHGKISLAIHVEGDCPALHKQETAAVIRRHYVGYVGLCLDEATPRDEWFRLIQRGRTLLRRSENLRPR